jgi:hypothetical protein
MTSLKGIYSFTIDVNLVNQSRVELILDNFSMQFPTVEECDFDRQFLFDEYVAISHRYDLRRVYH